MRVTDAVKAIRPGRRRAAGHAALSTVWSEQEPGRTPDEYPRPQLRRDNWSCLNGLWKYAFTDHADRPAVFDGEILVPFSPECARSGVLRRLEPGRYLWYFRTVFLRGIPSGKRLLLHFGAVDERCAVWWNGNLLGRHRNGYLAFSFDVTDYIREGCNTLWVRVQDGTDSEDCCRGKQTLNPGGMFYTAHSGIWQTVWLEWVPENYIRRMKITPLFDSCEVRIELELARPEPAEILVRGESTAYLHRVGRDDFREVREKKGSCPGSVSVSAQVALPELCPWSPERPFLYDLEIRAGEDSVRSYFAMRKFSVGTDGRGFPRLMLNNRPYFFNGVLDQGYWPESLCTPPSDEAMIFDISGMKELGFNMLRKHIKIEPMRWYYHCDRIGMVVWQDMVNGGEPLNLPFVCYLPTMFPFVTTRVKDGFYRLFGRKDRAARLRWEEDCMAAAAQLENCPCIGMWVLFNEGWGQFDALRITERIRKADPTRPVDHASGWFD